MYLQIRPFYLQTGSRKTDTTTPIITMPKPRTTTRLKKVHFSEYDEVRYFDKNMPTNLIRFKSFTSL
jgi:hypothetical protein